ncbi:MAG: hypothetical protein O9274_02240 [Limnobacter sp.]|uniref:hypothetical protein n=1 Tax=Limnobacter sp. TaxID=2003368 RepID=UPI0022C3B527|nr:hypothetical protein [Limnobacter sp.]MCZ8014495.1 hypothetical protein [Limnobacter sp.]
MDDPRKYYKDTTMRLLGRFQLLELALKVYVGVNYKVIQARVEGLIHFGYTEDDLSDLPLGRLLALFKKFNTNAELHARLQKLQTERNQIAHRSLLITMGSLYDRGAVEDKHIEYSMLEDELTECLQAVNAESKQLKKRVQSAA